MQRRNFLIGGLVSLFAAPAIVRCQSIMPVKVVRWPRPLGVINWESYPWSVTIDYDKVDPYHIDLDKLDFKCSYVPPDYVAAPLTVRDLEALQETNRNNFKHFVDELRWNGSNWNLIPKERGA